MRRRQGEVVTFKADGALLEAMQGIPNRSEFIRTAVLRALANICPVCKGSGILTPNQKRHWSEFARTHEIRECDDCHEFSLFCDKVPPAPVHNGPEPAPAAPEPVPHATPEVFVIDMSGDPARDPGSPCHPPIRVTLAPTPRTRKPRVPKSPAQ